jgi:hypothetical protein
MIFKLCCEEAKVKLAASIVQEFVAEDQHCGEKQYYIKAPLSPERVSGTKSGQKR